jgi:ribonuclease VapC
MGFRINLRCLASMVIAIFRQEDDAENYARRIATDHDPVMSAANLVETSIVLRGLKKIASQKAERWLDDFMKAAGIRIEPVTLDQAHAARSAHLQFSKGTGHNIDSHWHRVKGVCSAAGSIQAGTRPPKYGISARLSMCGRPEVKNISAPA